MHDKKEKLPISRILSNYWYLLKIAFQKDAGLVIMIFGVFTLAGVGYASMETIFMRTFINFLSDSSYTFKETAMLVLAATAGMAVLMAVDRSVESIHYPRMVRLAGMMQEEMITTAIYDLGRMGRNMLTVLVLSGLITAIDPVIAIFPVLGFLINVFSRFRIMKLEYEYDVEKKTIMRRANYSKRVFYQPEYAKEIKLSHIEVPLEKQFQKAVDDTIVIAKKYGVPISLWSLVNWITVFTLLSLFCVPLYLGYMALVACSITLGDVAALNNAQGIVRNRLDAVNYCIERIQRAGLFCERFRRFMEYEGKIERSIGTAKLPKEHSVLEIKNMSYRYDGAEKNTLKNINMRIEAGQKIAFVGENGAGKSTLIKLLMRLYDVTEGSIEYGGRDIREYSTDEYRDIFGSVFQDYQIYASSIRDNVIMNQNRADDEKQIMDALEQSGFAERLQPLASGLDTMLTREFSEDGVQLSGGEAQKVAIARLFTKKERMHIAILDEPSSALDPKAEYDLNQNIMNKAGDATVVFISHRLSTTRDADCIFMFENGEIVEKGTHRELMEIDGQYAEMFRCQAKYYQDNADVLA